MKEAIVYSSRTGNTKLLAEAVKAALPEENVVYFGEPDAKALEADRLYVGFWTDKGGCDELTEKFLKTVKEKELFLFGTAGFGENQDYFDKVLDRTAKHLDRSVRVVGRFMCQGKMPMAVRERYEKMAKSPIKVPNIQGMIENFDKALSHPDQKDLTAVQEAVRKLN